MELKQLISFICLLATVRAGTIDNRDCNNTVFINDKYYVSETLKTVRGIPADMAINYNSGNIYFTLVSSSYQMTLNRLKENLDLESINVRGIGQSTAVDQLNNIVYLATDNGIYKYNEETSKSELYAASGDDVMYLAAADNGRTLYSATWPQNRVRKLTQDGQTSHAFRPIANGHGITVDNQNNIFYVDVTAHYVLKNGETVPIKLNGLDVEKMVDFFVAKSGEVYAMDVDSNWFKIDPVNAVARKLGSFGIASVNTFIVDGNGDVVIGVKDTLWKWVPRDTNPCKWSSNKADTVSIL